MIFPCGSNATGLFSLTDVLVEAWEQCLGKTPGYPSPRPRQVSVAWAPGHSDMTLDQQLSTTNGPPNGDKGGSAEAEHAKGGGSGMVWERARGTPA